MDCSPPGSSVHERIQEWVAPPFSRGSSQPRNGTGVSCIAGRVFTIWATREAQVHDFRFTLAGQSGLRKAKQDDRRMKAKKKKKCKHVQAQNVSLLAFFYLNTLMICQDISQHYWKQPSRGRCLFTDLWSNFQFHGPFMLSFPFNDWLVSG